MCAYHPESPARYICQGESCFEKRIFCHACLKNNKHMHSVNRNELIEELPQILEGSRQDCDHLLEFIEETFKEIILFKDYLIRAIRKKYHIQIELFNEINIESKCQALDNLIKFKEDSKIIQQVLDQPFKTVLSHIKDGITDVCLEQVTYLGQMTEQERQQFQNHITESQNLFQSNRLEEALEKVERALIINPRDLDALIQKGNILMRLQRLKEAQQQFIQALKIDELHVTSRFALGSYYIRTNQRRQALQQYFKIIDINPGNQQAIIQIDQLLEETY
ncbi:unnamed protein product (macronuclear) [Paramecium tetraurelia]|uniref:Uncharacterized protein n=1 Tax=Paramecium tetraurelia TaxID=5888 RepID=A0BHV4_PARTE|nr:uncharacterized protein GSPATT00029157001 [Paramecium tetraurelia]CAK58121.1 unnamed protein product [Paramecium tetraurelia]|eukprot:XP_001425519.1 hypothetical protein (macronuclear) [Paramecium tetraurelia strain d4-2]